MNNLWTPLMRIQLALLISLLCLVSVAASQTEMHREAGDGPAVPAPASGFREDQNESLSDQNQVAPSVQRKPSASSTRSLIKDVASILQSISIALAALIGGVWALYIFRARRERDKAEVELAKARIETEKVHAELAELERTLHTEAKLVIEIETSSAPGERQGQQHLFVTVRMVNKGNRNIRVDLGDRALAVGRMAQRDKSVFKAEKTYYTGFTTFQELGHDALWNLPYTVIQAGSEKSLPFWIAVDSPGLYYVEFRALIIGPEAKEVPMQAGGERAHTFAERAYKYVLIT